MTDVFALYVAAHRHALRQLITGCDPVEVEAAATGSGISIHPTRSFRTL
jgi:hypothetical protein